jgi:hypothetical protein
MTKKEFILSTKNGVEFRNPKEGIVSFGYYGKNRYLVLYADGREEFMKSQEAYKFFQAHNFIKTR